MRQRENTNRAKSARKMSAKKKKWCNLSVYRNHFKSSLINLYAYSRGLIISIRKDNNILPICMPLMCSFNSITVLTLSLIKVPNREWLSKIRYSFPGGLQDIIEWISFIGATDAFGLNRSNAPNGVAVSDATLTMHTYCKFLSLRRSTTWGFGSGWNVYVE